MNKVYLVNGRWFDEQLGRFLSEDPNGYGSGQTNLYVLNGNDPFAVVSNTGIDWSKLEGPSPFNGLGAFAYGAFLDAVTFGHFDSITGFKGAQQQAAQSNWYYVGLGAGIAANIAVGNILGAGAGAAGASRASVIAGRAYLAYNVAGDAIGVYDSYTAYQNGTFGPLDAIGLVSSIGGLAGVAHGLGQAARSGRIAGNIDNATQAARVASQVNANPAAFNPSPVTASAVEGVIPRCFTADTEVLVMLPGIGADLSDQFAAAPPVSDNEAKTASGAWFLSGAALVALGIGVVATSLKEKQSTRKRKKELSDLDLLFCDYERMEAAVV